MADATKAQKLAAARKKLKEYQQKSHKPNKNVPESDENLAACETLSNSTQSSVNGNFDSVPSEAVGNPRPTQTSPFHTYFNGNQQSIFYQESGNFFDSLSSHNQNLYDTSNVDMTITSPNYFEDTTQTNGSQVVNPTVINDDARTLDYPEIKPNDIYGYFNKVESVEHPTISSEDAKKLSEYMATHEGDVGYNVSTKMREIDLDSPVSIEQDGYASHTHLQEPHSEYSSPLAKTPLNSNTESLRQLSSQITELIQDDVNVSPQQMSELERRNQELAALLEQERLESQKVHAQQKEHQNRISQLEAESQQCKVDFEHRLNRELGPLQEQLQCHAQTVGILVGEKTELSTALSQSQLVAKQKVVECEELQGRLKTSRSRVADLEKELQNFKTARTRLEDSGVHEEEVAKLRKEYQELKEQKEEASQDLLELREKLNIKANENLALQREVQEVAHQFSLAQVKIEQITAGESLQIESQVEILTQQKLALEKQVLELSQALKATGEERDQASVQYHHYVQQLNGQVASLANKLENVTTENESLAKREQNLVQHIGELEKHLQNIQDERINFATSRGSSSETKKELESALESIQTLQTEKSKLEENYQHVVGEREDLLRELESRKELVDQLEAELERQHGDQPDSVKLLAAMESDKVAASRAVAQNAELKQQLEEMQQAFVRMSNDKLDLTEKLTSEEFRSKELSDKLGDTESHLHTLSEAIAIKDSELTQMRETLTHRNKQILQQDQLADRLRHYEAQDGSSPALQLELQKALEQIQQLTWENTKLKHDMEHISRSSNTNLSQQQDLPQVKYENSVEMKTPGSDNEFITATEVASQTIIAEATSNQHIDVNILDKEVAMKHLEDKFTHTMLDIANLTEEKQRLEHLVTQLQSETETIGEYIALYQHQRGVLRQRTQEKDEQLKRLAQDREKVRSKLDLLNGLVKKLVLEKGVLTPEILEQHKQLNSQSHELCSEHAKIQQEINKIAQQNMTSDEHSQEPHVNENNNVSTETAEEIIALLAEIKSSNLIQPSDGLEHFHPCPWCSGQLLTV